MSDADLRELERRYRETGSVEDEAAWLRGRVQRGGMSQERLELAAFCRWPAALSVLEREDTRSVEDWLAALPADRVFLQRFVLAGGTAALVAWQRDHPDWPAEFRAREAACTQEERIQLAIFGPAFRTQSTPRHDEPEEAIRAAEQVIVCPCEVHVREVHELIDGGTSQGFTSAGAAFGAAGLVASRSGEEIVDSHTLLAAQAVMADACLALADPDAESVLGEVNVRERRRMTRLAPGSIPDCPRVWERVTQDVVPWALGYSDPVRERVEARQRAEAAGE